MGKEVKKMADILQIDKGEVEAVRSNVVKSLEAWLGQMQRMDRSVASLQNRNKGAAVTALVELYNKHAPLIRTELESFMTGYNETVKKTCDALFEVDTNTGQHIMAQ